MFINSVQLKRLMKKDFKGPGLRIGNLEEGYCICSNMWALHIRHDGIPNTVKALIMELAGVLPEPGEIYRVSKDNPLPQHELDIRSGDSFHLVAAYRSARKAAVRTKVYEEYGGTLFGLVQSNWTGELVGVQKELLDLIDFDAVDRSVEDLPGNPCYRDYMGTGIFWHNGTTTLKLRPDIMKSDVAEALQGIVFDPHLLRFMEEDHGEET